MAYYQIRLPIRYASKLESLINEKRQGDDRFLSAASVLASIVKERLDSVADPATVTEGHVHD